jgi:hypothetical protein
MGERSICGAVSGALASLSILLGEQGYDDQVIAYTVKKYKIWFRQQFGDLTCAVLTQPFRNEEGEIMEGKHEARHVMCTSFVIESAKKIVELIEYNALHPIPATAP